MLNFHRVYVASIAGAFVSDMPGKFSWIDCLYSDECNRCHRDRILSHPSCTRMLEVDNMDPGEVPPQLQVIIIG